MTVIGDPVGVGPVEAIVRGDRRRVRDFIGWPIIPRGWAECRDEDAIEIAGNRPLMLRSRRILKSRPYLWYCPSLAIE